MGIVIFFIMTSLNQVLAILKNIATINKQGKLMYIFTGIDAVIFAFAIKSLVLNDVSLVAVYVIAKLIGVYLATVFDDKLIKFGYYDITLYVPTLDLCKELQQDMLDNNISSTAFVGIINEDKERYLLSIQIKKKEFNIFNTILINKNIDNATMVIREAKSITGKLKERL